MLKNISDFIKLIAAYLEDKSLFTATHQLKAINLSKDEDRLIFVISTIRDQFKQMTFDMKFKVIAAIDELLISKKKPQEPRY